MANVHKAVICGAGFLGSSIARSLVASSIRVQATSRHPERVYDKLKNELAPTELEHLLAPVSADITKPETLTAAFRDAKFVISLVGLMQGSDADFDRIQWKGAENVARAAQEAGSKLVHFSAIGADPESDIPYFRTKGLGERAVFEQCPTATVIRPSLVFGPEDNFFNRFKRLSTFLPFLPVFGGGTSLFQPVYVGDLARVVELMARGDPGVDKELAGKVIEAGGPDVLSYRQIMESVLRYSERSRLILSLPFWVGILQGTVLEQLPPNLFTVTRSQVKQLGQDNMVGVTPVHPPHDMIPLQTVFQNRRLGELASLHKVLPQYL